MRRDKKAGCDADIGKSGEIQESARAKRMPLFSGLQSGFCQGHTFSISIPFRIVALMRKLLTNEALRQCHVVNE
jgi:hypothetical protein